MCDISEETKSFKLEKPLRAYKVLEGSFTGPYSCTRIKRGEWMKAEIERDGGKCGPWVPGWRVFLELRYAEAYARALGAHRRIEAVQIKGECRIGETQDWIPSPAPVVAAEYIQFGGLPYRNLLWEREMGICTEGGDAD